jgi:YVTN family beta-propeller protein
MRLINILLAFSIIAVAQSTAPLRLEKTIPMPGVHGRIDHMSFDVKRRRLFVAALGNNTVEVIDTEQGKRIHSIPGLHEPQGVLYLPDVNKLYVANGDDGTLRIFDGKSYKPIISVNLGDDADNIRFDAQRKQIYAGYGDGGLAVMSEEGANLRKIQFDSHPESFQLEKNGPRLFVNLPKAREVVVLNRVTASLIAKWTTDEASSNFPMALDEEDHRLFIVCRVPARLVVLDTDTGKLVEKLPTIGDSDDVFYNRTRKQIYVTGGEGGISVYQQDDADHYREIATVPTVKGARTSFFSLDLRKLFVAVRAQGSDPAAIRVYSTQ